MIDGVKAGELDEHSQYAKARAYPSKAAGAKAIEFEKGKTAIIVPSKEQLVATLDTLIEGVKAGELDEHLAQQAKARGVPKSKRAA